MADNELALQLAGFISEVDRVGIPDAAIHAAKRAVLDFLGCALAGTRDLTWSAARDVLVQAYPGGTATVIGNRGLLPVPEAVFLNAAAGNILDFDDTHSPTIIHPSATIIPVLLALAEQRTVSGRAFLESLVLALEVSCRIGRMVHPAHYASGLHITATCGGFGAAAAAGLVEGLSAREITSALGIAAGQAAGLIVNLAMPAKSVAVGGAARNGFLAAYFAKAGIVASPAALEGRHGFFDVLGKQEPDWSALDGLGYHWEIVANMHKPYPVGVVLNPVIDACLAVRERSGFDPAHIREIKVFGHDLLVARADRPEVASTADARLSTQHTAAVTLLLGAPDLAAFQAEALSSEAVALLRHRVRVSAHPEIDVDGARVTVIFDNGEECTEVVEAATGSRKKPMSDSAIATKTARLCAWAGRSDDVAPLIDAIWTLDRDPDAGRVLRRWMEYDALSDRPGRAT